jgi:hypothetical protein
MPVGMAGRWMKFFARGAERKPLNLLGFTQ